MSVFDEDDDSISTIMYFKLRNCPWKTQVKVSFTVKKELEEKDLNSRKSPLASNIKAKRDLSYSLLCLVDICIWGYKNYTKMAIFSIWIWTSKSSFAIS